VTGIRFEWDEAKNLSNRRKHGVSFEEASRVFLDPLHFSVLDRIENGEERWRTFGTVESLMLMVVAHTIRDLYGESDAAEVVRIISARETTRRERRLYEDENS
jgi:uncharacterized DUF497 family protein